VSDGVGPEGLPAEEKRLAEGLLAEGLLAEGLLAEGLLVGLMGGSEHARVGGSGSLRPGNVSWSLDWWIGADDRWHVPGREAAVRQSLVDGMPVVRTAMRVPGGDAVATVGALPDPEPVAVLDITDDSPAPFVLALVIRDACAIEVEGTSVFVDGTRALRLTRAPSRWATGAVDAVERVVTGGDAAEGPFPATSSAAGDVCGALLFPVTHRTTFRVVVALDPRGMSPLDPPALPGTDAMARGWRAQLGRGMRVELPEAALQDAIDSARAAVLVAGQLPGVAPATVAALEDWGFDAEAREAWTRLGRRDRKEAARRTPGSGDWGAVRSAIGAPVSAGALLLAARAAVVHERGDVVDLLPSLPDDWRGAPLDVREVPTARGLVSCSVRWHGERPALLWDAPAGITVRAPALDAHWSSREPSGEALLGGSADTAN
jgi:hypothetical protein